MADSTPGLTDSEEKELLDLLSKVGTVFSYNFFNLIAERFVMIPVEAVTLRKKGDKIQVLLLEREEKDSVWGGLLHSPGTILRASDVNDDKSYKNAFLRLEEREIGNKFSKEPIFLRNWFHRVKRGVENAMIFVCTIEGEPKNGQFYNIDDLPENVVETQIEFIKYAAQEAKRLKII